MKVIQYSLVSAMCAVLCACATMPWSQPVATLTTPETCDGKACSSVFIQYIDDSPIPGYGPYKLKPGHHIITVDYSNSRHTVRASFGVDLKPDQHYAMHAQDQGYYLFSASLENLDTNETVELGSGQASPP